MGGDPKGLTEKRRAIRHLLRQDDPADAMASYYAYHHPDAKTSLFITPESGAVADGYIAVSRTGIDLFRPLVTMRLPTDRTPGLPGQQKAVDMIRRVLEPGRPVILNIPDRYLPLIQAIFTVQSQELLRLYILDRQRFEPIINVLVVRSDGPNNLPRFLINSNQGGESEVVASAALNWQSPNFAELAVNTRPQHRRQGWGRSVVAAMAQYLLDTHRTPLYVASDENEPSIQLAESVGFVDTGRRDVLIQGFVNE